MTTPSNDELDVYLADAGSWASDRNDELRSSRRAAWTVASVAVVVALFEAFALMLLMPLKRVEPYTLMVDRQTGYVQLLKPLNPELVSSDAALTQSFLVQYVIAREGYDVDVLQSDYRKVALWSAGTARAEYLAAMPVSNPTSPLALYPRSTIVDVRVKSVTSLGANSALVRFETARRDVGRQTAPARAWVAVIRYGYANGAMTAEDRFVNPLGFQVLRYRRSAETLSPPEPSAKPSAPTMIPARSAVDPATALAPPPYGPGPYRGPLPLIHPRE